LPDVLAALDSDAPIHHLSTLRAALPDTPEVTVDTRIEARLRNGDSRALDSLAPPGAELFKVISKTGNLIAIARTSSRVTAIIERIFNPEPPD